VDGQERQKEEAKGALAAAVEWAFWNAAKGYHGDDRDGKLSFVVRVVVSGGQRFVGRSRKGYAEALEDAHRRFRAAGG
jgi:hypothetical protein